MNNVIQEDPPPKKKKKTKKKQKNKKKQKTTTKTKTKLNRKDKEKKTGHIFFVYLKSIFSVLSTPPLFSMLDIFMFDQNIIPTNQAF